MKAKNILLGVTGSIAAYKACEIIKGLKQKGHRVTCVMTRDAEEFITPLTLETLSGNKVHRKMFELPEKREIAHISLADKADLILIAPATANIIAKIASGICDDLLTATVISSKKNVLIAPAMNTNMYKHKITQKNIRDLEKLGFKFVGPACGKLACGTEGVGRLAKTDLIVTEAAKLLK